MIYIYYQGDPVPKVSRNVTSVIIHHSVTSIEAFAFEGCRSLVFIYIPSSVKKIGVCAFRGCTKIMAIHLPPTMKIIGLRAFKDCRQLVTLELPPPKVMPILGDSLLQGCVSLDRTSNMTDREFSSWLRRRFDNLPLHRICYRTNVTVKAIKNCIKDQPSPSHTSAVSKNPSSSASGPSPSNAPYVLPMDMTTSNMAMLVCSTPKQHTTRPFKWKLCRRR